MGNETEEPWIVLSGCNACINTSACEKLGNSTSYDESGEYETRWHSKGGFIPACNGVIAEQNRVKSAATMPKSAARTRFKIVGCEAVRVQGLTVGNGLELGCSSGNWGSARKLIISKFGQSAWDNNDYIWFYKI
jgi:hypothetical protein